MYGTKLCVKKLYKINLRGVAVLNNETIKLAIKHVPIRQ